MDLADLGLRFTPAGSAEANKALDQITEKSAKAEKATDSLAFSQTRAKTATGQATSEFMKVSQAMGGIQTGATGASGALGGLGAAAGVAGIAVVALAAAFALLKVGLDKAREATKWADDLKKTADAAGIATDKLQALNYAAAKTGLSATAISGSLGRLNGVLGDIQAGGASKNLQQLFASLGFTQAQIRSYHDASDILPKLADSLASIGSKAERVKVAQMLGLEEALPLLEKGSGALSRYGDEARRLGLVVSSDVVGPAAELNRQLTINDEIIKTKLNAAYLSLSPILRETSNLLVGLVSAFAAFADKIGKAASAVEDWARRHKVSMAGIAAATASTFFGPGAGELAGRLVAGQPKTRMGVTGRQMGADAASGQAATGSRQLIFDAPAKSRAPQLSEEERQYRATLKAAQDYAKNLSEQTDQLGMTEEERVRYRSGLELEALSHVKATAATLAAADAIRAETDERVKRLGVLELEAAAKSVDTARKKAPDATPALDAATANADALNNYADLLDQTAQHTRDAAQGMADAFGTVGGAVGNLASVLADLDARQADIAARRATELEHYQQALVKAAGDKKAIDAATLNRDKALLMADRDAKQATIKGYGDQIGAVKGFFNEKSRAYKALTIAEQAFRVLELANSIRAMVQKAIEHSTDAAGAGLAAGATVAAEGVKTGTTLIGAAIRIPIKIAEGAASMFAALGPFAFPVIGAMLAVMAGLGFGGKGGGGGAVVTAEQRQKTQGTGSVLGDPSAKSESIAKSLEIVAANSNKDFEYFNPMLRALKSIDSNIGTLTAALARQLGVGGAFDTSDLGLGTVKKGNLFTSFGLTSKKTTSLTDQGIVLDPQTLGQIVNGGVSGSTYSDISTNTKKSFLGITYSNKTKNSTVTDPLSQDILGEVSRVIESLRAGVLSAAGTLGVAGAQATIDAFQVNLGKISFKDMTGQEIQDTLNAVFGKLGDDLASAVLPDIEKFQKAGEGALETLVRVARGYQVVDVSLQSIGRTFGAVGVASIEARQRLIDLVGSIDDLAEQTQFFADNFLTDIERMAPIQASVTKELERLNLSQVKTKEQFKQVVLGLDLTTEAGAQMYASLLALAPAFAKVADYVVDGSKAMQDALGDLSKAYEAEAQGLQDTIDKFSNFADSLKKFRDQLDTGPAALLSPEAQYKASQAAFLDVSAKAKLGDATALGNLQSVSQSYLDASKAYYASSGNYFKDLEAVKAAVTAAQGTAQRTADNATLQLQALKDLVSPLIDINKSVLSVHDAILAVNGVKAQQAAAVATATANLYPATSTTAATGGATGSTSTAPNWTTYLTHYADVAAEYANNVMGKDPRFKTAEAYAQWHYENYGQAEGRVPYARGTILDRPTHIGSFGIAGEAGPEAIMPLVNGPNGLSVRAHGSNDNEALIGLIRELIAEVKADKPQRAQIAQALLDAHDKSARKVSSAVERGPTNARLARGG